MEIFCFIDPEGATVSVKMLMSNALMAGGDFKIFYKDSTKVLENWKMSGDSKNPDEKILRTKKFDLNKSKLAWNILTCSKDADIYTGVIEIKVYQGLEECKMNYPARQKIENIPPCKIKGAQETKGSLTFFIKK
jgi:hypothetical protein